MGIEKCLNILRGLFRLLLLCVSFIFASQYFKIVKTQGASSFSLLAIWSSVAFGIILLILGLPLVL